MFNFMGWEIRTLVGFLLFSTGCQVAPPPLPEEPEAESVSTHASPASNPRRGIPRVLQYRPSIEAEEASVIPDSSPSPQPHEPEVDEIDPQVPVIETDPDPAAVVEQTPESIRVEVQANENGELTVSAIPEFQGNRPSVVERSVPIFPTWVDFEAIIGAKATFEILINESGQVEQTRLLDATHPDVIEPSREALVESRFTITRDPFNQPIRVWIEESVEF